jgi:hypothetical protein
METYKTYPDRIAFKGGTTAYFKQDGDTHWYWIPEDKVALFEKLVEDIIGIDYMDNPDAFDRFSEEFEEYRTLGDKLNCPDIWKVYYDIGKINEG